MRRCKDCGDANVNPTGVPVCKACSANRLEARLAAARKRFPRQCLRCGEAKVRYKLGTPVCADCRTTNDDGTRKKREKTCRDCGRVYLTTSGNEICSVCTHHKSKHPCPDCGAPADKRAERCRHCARRLQVGALSPGFNGGRRLNGRGYIMVMAPTGHPRAQPKSKYGHGYALEHILVVEDALGRYLHPGETVHHKNGVKDDNRLENLELFISSHPPGQRVIDKVKWAREIIERYGDEVERLPT